ncbi:hypothetical protein ACFSHR_02735 [Azotobacter chroococcum]
MARTLRHTDQRSPLCGHFAAGNHASLILDNQWSVVARVRDGTDAQDEIEDACLGPGKTPSEDVLHGLLTA